MILPLACLLLCIAAGVMAVERHAGVAEAGPRWAARTLACGAGTALGIGGAALLYWITTLLSLPAWLVPAAAAALLGWFAYNRIRASGRRERHTPEGVEVSRARLPGAILAPIGMAAALAATTAVTSLAWDIRPHGGWDAWAIWNLRAKYLAGGLPERAWARELSGTTHPEYPLLLSSAVALLWSCGASNAPAAPAALNYVFFLSVAATTLGGVAILRGPAAGWMAGLILICSPALAAEVPAQYADVPLSAYFACALIFILLKRPVWAGVFAGLAAWTKDEGVLFCAVLLAGVAWFRRPELLRFLLGLLPGVLAAAGFKIFFAPLLTSLFSGGLGARLLDGGRYGLLVKALAGNLLALGAGWYHPALPLIAYAASVRFRLRPEERELRLLAAFLVMTMMAGYSAVLVVSPNDLDWQLGTALGRILVQWWPLVLIGAIFWLRSPEEPAGAAAFARSSTPDRM